MGQCEAGIQDGRTALHLGEEGGVGPDWRGGGGGAFRGEAVATPAGGSTDARNRGAADHRSAVSEVTR